MKLQFSCVSDSSDDLAELNPNETNLFPMLQIHPIQLILIHDSQNIDLSNNW